MMGVGVFFKKKRACHSVGICLARPMLGCSCCDFKDIRVGAKSASKHTL